MQKINALIIIVCSLSVLACNTLGGQGQPVVDPYGDPNASRINQDLEECRMLAQQASGASTLKDTAIGAGVGGLVGAAAGAAIGAAAGNPATGAAIGAAAGGFGGGAKQGFGAENSYERAYANCMAGRGHRVIR